MSPIGLVIKPGIKEAITIGAQIVSWARERSLEIVIESSSLKAISKKIRDNSLKGASAEELARSADPIISLGGDGTLIGIARYVEGRSPVMIGVNFGQLGFLTEIRPGELLSVLEQVLNNGASFAERTMLLTEVVREGKVVFQSQAVNDAVIQKGVRDKLLDLDLVVNDQEVMRLRADGLIIATPTGSTAYSLSAGGSIVHPTLEVALVTPICPHSLTNRPLILGLNAVVEVRIPPYDGEVFLIIDGQVSFPMKVGDVLRVRKASNTVRFVQSPHKSYFEILRTKLNWGIANKPE